MNGVEVILTDHAKDRAWERFKLREPGLRRACLRALEDGIGHEELNGRLRRYVDRLWLAGGHTKADNIMIHAEKVFVFNGFVLVTIWQIPRELREYARKREGRKK